MAQAPTGKMLDSWEKYLGTKIQKTNGQHFPLFNNLKGGVWRRRHGFIVFMFSFVFNYFQLFSIVAYLYGNSAQAFFVNLFSNLFKWLAILAHMAQAPTGKMLDSWAKNT